MQTKTDVNFQVNVLSSTARAVHQINNQVVNDEPCILHATRSFNHTVCLEFLVPTIHILIFFKIQIYSYSLFLNLYICCKLENENLLFSTLRPYNSGAKL